jgi:hypothetical protein
MSNTGYPDHGGQQVAPLRGQYAPHGDPDPVNKRSFRDNLVVSELTALGAASMLPGYEYRVRSGNRIQ